MKFTVKTEINLPLDKVVALYTNYDNLKEWQTEFKSYELISGKPNEQGTVTKLVYKSITKIETITSQHLPAEISAEYEHIYGKKTMMIHVGTNRFTSLGENKTLYEIDMELTKFFGFLPKLMAKFMGGAVRKYYQTWVDKFKAFAEK